MRRLIFEVCANCGKKITDDEVAEVVDEHNDLIFCNANCAHEYFETEIDQLEAEHLKLRAEDDVPLKDYEKFEHFLPMLLHEPDEIWEPHLDDDKSPISFYIGEFFHETRRVFYIAAVYRIEENPSFVYMHFPTYNESLVEKYRQGELAYDGAEETESLLEDEEVTEGNIAIELYNEMLDHRSDIDIDPEDFGSYSDLKILTVEKPDEIWKRIDDSGNTFIIYISHHRRENETLAYVVVAVEDDLVGAAIPIFGFPTLDQKLLDRFRVGELVSTTREEEF